MQCAWLGAPIYGKSTYRHSGDHVVFLGTLIALLSGMNVIKQLSKSAKAVSKACSGSRLGGEFPVDDRRGRKRHANKAIRRAGRIAHLEKW